MSTASSNSSLYAGSAEEIIDNDTSSLSEHITSTIIEAFSSETLDRCIALQSQTSGMIHAQSASLKALSTEAEAEISAMKQEFVEGAKTAKMLKAELRDLQLEIQACQELAKKKIPVEWHNVRDGLVASAEDEG